MAKYDVIGRLKEHSDGTPVAGYIPPPASSTSGGGQVSSTPTGTNIKYYATIDNKITYRVGGAEPPAGAKEITQQQYESYKQVLASGGTPTQKVVQRENGKLKTYEVPISATVSGGFSDESQRLATKKAEQILTEARRAAETASKAGYDYAEVSHSIAGSKATEAVSGEYREKLKAQRLEKEERERIAQEAVKKTTEPTPDMFGAETITAEKKPEGIKESVFAWQRKASDKTLQQIEKAEAEGGLSYFKLAYLTPKKIGLDVIGWTKPFTEPKETGAKLVLFFTKPYKKQIKEVTNFGVGVVTGAVESLVERPVSTVTEAYLFYKAPDIFAGGKRVVASISNEIKSIELTEEFVGESTTALVKRQTTSPIVSPTKEVMVSVKPLEEVRVFQTIRDTKQMESVIPKYGQEIDIPLRELQKQSPISSVTYESELFGRMTPKSAQTTTQPSAVSAFEYGTQKAGKYFILTKELEAIEFPMSRFTEQAMPENVGTIRQWGTGKFIVEPVELSLSREVMQTGRARAGKAEPVFGEISYEYKLEGQKEIQYTYKLGGKVYDFTESGELLGGRSYGIGGEKFYPAPPETKGVRFFNVEGEGMLAMNVKESTSVPFGRITKIKVTEKPTETKPKVFTEKALPSGLVVLQELEPQQAKTQKAEQLFEPLSEQKQKEAVLEKTKQKQNIFSEQKGKQVYILKEKVEPTQKTSQLLRQEAIPLFKAEQKQKVFVLTSQKQNQSQSQRQKQEQKQEQKTFIEPILDTKKVLIEIQKPIQAQRQQPKEDEEERILLFPRIKSPMDFTKVPEPKEPERKKPPFTNIFDREKQSKGFFSAEVRRGGKFMEIGRFGTAEKAFEVAETRVSTTAAASLRVRNPFGEVISEPVGLSSEQFTRSKKELGVFVEKPSKRIKSQGEKQEITFKGIAAQRQRKANIFSLSSNKGKGIFG